MTAPVFARRSGFTLIEMMVALFIFGLLASASVILLRQSVSAQAQSAVRLDEQGALRRFSALAGQDFANLAVRVSRDELGAPVPAFAASEDSGRLIEFARFTAVIDPREAASTLQRVRYGLADGRLVRSVARFGDGAAMGAPLPVLEGVSRVAIRYRDKAGLWNANWQPQRQEDVPVAVEFSLYRDAVPNGEPLVLRFLIGGRE
ncbi:MAG: type II secretion system minor pseudopilin GspJ [Blastomonas sp.]